MGERWRIDLMGMPRVSYCNRERIPLQNLKTDALLAYLAFYHQKPHSREELAELFWPETDSATGRNRLSLALARLRRRLMLDNEEFASLLIADKLSIALSPNNVAVDMGAFEAAVAAARRAVTSEARIAASTAVIAAYGGELLPGFYEDWIISERRRLSIEFLKAHLALSRLRRERDTDGDLTAAEGYARAAVALSPTQEDAHLELMRVLDAAGRRAEALSQFQEMKRILDNDLGETPSTEAMTLAERLRARPVSAGVSGVSPQAGGGDGIGRRWAAPPAPLTRFFGREVEITCIEADIDDGTRFINLLGAGGSGKTRLCIEAVRRFTGRFDGAVAWTPLAGIADSRRVPDAIARALRLDVQGGDDIVEAIVRRLGDVPTALLVLDNMEHLLTAPVSPDLPLLLRHLLEEVPGLTILATSRQRVGIEGEREITVSPLPLPPAAAQREVLAAVPCVALFVNRAQGVAPGFRFTEANAADVAALCTRLEGIPLAIELCAAWTRTLTPAEMLARLGDRFTLLVSHRIDSPERHRTLSAAISYSYDLLPAELRSAFLRLSVFRGGWTSDAADGLGVDLATLTALRERSLIHTDEGGNENDENAAESVTAITPGLRFMMLETLREFARAHLSIDEIRDLCRRHAGWFQDLAEAVRPHLTAPDQAVYFALLEAEHDNLRAMLQWYLDTNDAENGLHLCGALHSFWNVRGHLVEGLEWLNRFERLPSAASAPLKVRASARRTLSRVQHWLGEYDDARWSAEEAVALSEEAGDEHGIASSFLLLGNVQQFTGENDPARISFERSLAIGRKIGSDEIIGSCLNNLGLTENGQSRWEAARAYFTEALTIFRRVGHRNHQANALGNIAVSLIYGGDPDAAFPYLLEALAIHRSLGNRGGMALTNLAVISRRRQDYAAARSFLHEALTEEATIERRYLLAAVLRETGHLDVAEGHWERGAYLLGASQAMAEAVKMTFAPPEADDIVRARNALLNAIGEVRREAAWQTGRYATLPQAVSAALAANKG